MKYAPLFAEHKINAFLKTKQKSFNCFWDVVNISQTIF